MNIHEYQAKEILKNYGISVPPGGVARTPEEAEQIARKLECERFVVKAQIHAGGRGKAGGIKLANNPEEVREVTKEIIGMRLVTHQTGKDGKLVRAVLIEEASNIEKELYLGIIVDRAISQIVMIASESGGMEIEEIAAEQPEKILRESIDLTIGLASFQARKLAYNLNVPKQLVNETVKNMMGLYDAFVACDCSLAEINPFAITADGNVVAIDAKMNFDDNALFKHEAIAKLRDADEEDVRELEASGYGLSWVSLDGNIGCMVNGAGLAMATMDLIKLHKGKPANFLDVGGSASAEQITQALKLILSDKKVRAILVNIFGGIMKCDVIAEGIIKAAGEVKFSVPLVVRLEGTNVELGKRLLAESKLNVISADGLEEAARKAVMARWQDG